MCLTGVSGNSTLMIRGQGWVQESIMPSPRTLDSTPKYVRDGSCLWDYASRCHEQATFMTCPFWPCKYFTGCQYNANISKKPSLMETSNSEHGRKHCEAQGSVKQYFGMIFITSCTYCFQTSGQNV